MLRGIRHASLAIGDRLRVADWPLIFRELAIVVFGILIAFQLDRLGESWADRREEKDLLERLSEETTGDLKALRAIREDHALRAKEALLLARAMDNPRIRSLLGRGEETGCGLLRLPAVRLASNDLASAERLASLSDEQLRVLLRHALGERSFNAEQLTYFRDAFQRFGQTLDPYTRWRFAGNRQVCRVALDELAADPAAVSLLARVYRDQERFVGYRTREIEALERVQGRVACLRAGNCPA